LVYAKQQQFAILAVLLTAVLKFIFMDWLNWSVFYITGMVLFWSVYILYRVKSNRDILILWGFKRAYFKQSMLYLAPLIFITGVVSVLYGSSIESLSFSWYFFLVLLLYPFWGLIQQFMMLSIISQNLYSVTEGKMNKYLIVFLVSVLFSLVHYPSFFLMIFTFFLEVVFITVYLKWRNLWAIGIAHGWIATFILYYVQDRNLWSELFSAF
jgi:Type II CAAX prenyl endopeptidase Rce1-like